MSRTESPAVARVYLDHVDEAKVVVNLPKTNYRLHLHPVAPVRATPGQRIKGVIRLHAWKVDFLSAGGSYIEPVVGRPRRVHGRVLGPGGEGNAVILEVAETPVLADLPERWPADTVPAGSRVWVEAYRDATFEAVSAPARGIATPPSV